jgi:hypothetical protein
MLADMHNCGMIEWNDAIGEVTVHIDIGVSSQQTGTGCLVFDITSPGIYSDHLCQSCFGDT